MIPIRIIEMQARKISATKSRTLGRVWARNKMARSTQAKAFGLKRGPLSDATWQQLPRRCSSCGRDRRSGFRHGNNAARRHGQHSPPRSQIRRLSVRNARLSVDLFASLAGHPSFQHLDVSRFKGDHVRPEAGGDTTQFVSETQKLRRRGGRKAQSGAQRHIEKSDGIAYRARHVERGAGERPSARVQRPS